MSRHCETPYIKLKTSCERKINVSSNLIKVEEKHLCGQNNPYEHFQTEVSVPHLR